VRGAIFSIITGMGVEGARVLDLYAGTGALGIEALSRGAEWADFVERDPRHCSLIKENLKLTGLASRAHVYCASVKKALSFLKESYDLIFLDPPYSISSLPSVLEELAGSGLAGSLVIVCHSSRVSLDPTYGELSLFRERNYGDSTVSIYRREGNFDQSSVPW